MAFTHVASLGTGTTTGAASIQVTVGGAINVPVEDVVVVMVAWDNGGTTDAETTQLSVTDSQGNTYTRAVELTNGQGSLNAGVTSGIFFSKITTALVIAIDSITVNSTNNAKGAVTINQFTGFAGDDASVGGKQTNFDDSGTAGNPNAMTLNVANADWVWLHVLGSEGPDGDVYTYSTNYTNVVATGTTGGVAAGNISVRGEWRILTAASGTVDMGPPASTRDLAQGYVSLGFPAAAAGPPAGGLLLLGAGV